MRAATIRPLPAVGGGRASHRARGDGWLALLAPVRCARLWTTVRGVPLTHALDVAAGALLALLVIAGRSSLARLVPGAAEGALTELRLWTVVLLVFTALARVGVTPDARITLRGLPARALLPTLPLLAVPLLLLASAMWSSAAVDPQGKAYEMLLLLVTMLSMLALRLVGAGSRVILGFVVALTAVLAAMALVGLRAALQGVTGRLAVLGGGPNVFGRLMALLALFVLGTPRPRIPVTVRAAAAIVPVLLLLLSGSRGALLSFIAGTAVILVAPSARRSASRVLLLLGAGGVAVLVATPLGRAVLTMLEERVLSLLVDRLYTSGRDALYEVAAAMIADAPLAGRGLSGFVYNTFHYPHNLMLEVWVEGGLPAVGALVAGLVIAFATGWVALRATVDRSFGSALAVPLIATWVAQLVAAQFSGDAFDSRAVFLMPLLWVPVTWSATRHPLSSRAPHPTPVGAAS